MKFLKILIGLFILAALVIGGVKLIKKRAQADEKLPPAEKIALVVQ